MACNITNCIHFLATHPDIQQQIRNELSLLDEALDEMLSTPGPYMLHVAIDDKFNVWPLVPPGAANNDMLYDMEKK